MGHRKVSRLLLGRQREIQPNRETRMDRGTNTWNSTGSWADSKRLGTQYCTEWEGMSQNGDVSIWSCVSGVYHRNMENF